MFYSEYVASTPSWTEAKTACQPGHLAIIHDQATLDVVASLIPVKYDAWIGLNDLAQNDWRWMDNSPISFKSWGPGQPNLKSQKCVVMEGAKNPIENRKKKWFTASCSSHFSSYICQWSSG